MHQRVTRAPQIKSPNRLKSGAVSCLKAVEQALNTDCGRFLVQQFCIFCMRTMCWTRLLFHSCRWEISSTCALMRESGIALITRCLYLSHIMFYTSFPRIEFAVTYFYIGTKSDTGSKTRLNMGFKILMQFFGFRAAGLSKPCLLSMVAISCGRHMTLSEGPWPFGRADRSAAGELAQLVLFAFPS